MPTGGFLGHSPTSRASGNANANSIFLTSLVAQQNGSAVALLLDTPSATAITTFRALIYDGSHSALLASSAQITAIAANYNRIPYTTPLSLVAGTTYYVGYVCSTSLPVSTQGSGGPGSWFVSGGQSVTSPANPLATGAVSAVSLMLALELDGTSAAGFGYSLDQSASVTLSSSNTVATMPTQARKGGRSVVTQVSGTGKWYAEVLVGGTINANVGVGLATANYNLNNSVNAGTTAQAYISLLLQTGTLQNTASTTALGLGYVSGDVIGIAYDATANLVWFSKNGGSFFGASSTAGNPTAGTGGAAFEATQWPVTVATSTGAASTVAAFTLRDTAGALQYTPPSGFAAWSAATYPPAAGLRRRVMVVG
jgi:hypothetical protein